MSIKKNALTHRVATDAELKMKAALINLAAVVIASASFFVIFTATPMTWSLWLLAVLGASASVIVLFESAFLGRLSAPLDSAGLVKLNEIAQRNPEVARWAAVAVRDGRTLRERDLDAAKATDDAHREAVAREKAIDALRDGTRASDGPGRMG